MFLLDDVIDNNFLNHNVNEGSVVNFIIEWYILLIIIRDLKPYFAVKKQGGG